MKEKEQGYHEHWKQREHFVKDMPGFLYRKESVRRAVSNAYAFPDSKEKL